MSKKVVVPEDRAKLYEEVLGKQQGDNVIIKNKSLDMKGMPKPIHNTLTSVFGILKFAVAIAILVFTFVLSVVNARETLSGDTTEAT